MIKIKKVVTPDDIKFCSRAILAFRPELKANSLVEQTLEMIKEGFQLIYIADDNDTEATSIAGFRTFEMYRTGRIIYIDDLFTFPENRGKGYAGALLDHIHLLAREEGIKTVHLDSGYHLHPAHRLYLNKGYILPCHHFAKTIA
jgi:GNAT superfamily N-acetyltransferase